MPRLRLLAALLLSFGLLPAQTVLRVGALTGIPGILDPIKAHLEKELGIQLVYKEENAAEMLPDVQEGRLDLALAGLTIEAWVEAARAKGHPVHAAKDFRSVQMGMDRVCLLVSPDVVTSVDQLVTELTRAQVKGLFSGRIKNWKEVGGPDLPVTVMVSHWFVSTLKVFKEKVMDGEPLAAGCRTLEGSLYEIPKALVATPGAITIGPAGLAANTKIWSPSLATNIERPFTMVISDKLDAEKRRAVDRMVAYIQGPGQAFITK